MSGKILLSAFTGFFFSLISYFVLLLTGEAQALVLAALGGVLFAFLLFCYLLIHGYSMGKRYARYEKEITAPIFHKANGNIRFQDVALDTLGVHTFTVKEQRPTGGKLDGVTYVSISFMAQRMTLEADDAVFDKVAKEAAKACRKVDADCRVILK